MTMENDLEWTSKEEEQFRTLKEKQERYSRRKDLEMNREEILQLMDRISRGAERMGDSIQVEILHRGISVWGDLSIDTRFGKKITLIILD